MKKNCQGIKDQLVKKDKSRFDTFSIDVELIYYSPS